MANIFQNAQTAMGGVKDQLRKRMSPIGQSMPAPSPHLPGTTQGQSLPPATPHLPATQGQPMPAPTPHLPATQGQPLPAPTPHLPATQGQPLPPAVPHLPGTQSAPGPMTNSAPAMGGLMSGLGASNARSDSDPRGWFMDLASQYAPGGKINQDGLKALSNDPQFQQAGWKLGNPNATGVIDSVIGPQGQVVDVSRNATAGGGTGDLYWGAYEGSGNWAEDASGGAGGGGGTPGAPGSAGAGGGFNSNVRDMLMDLIKKSQQPITEDDPAISGQIQSQDRLAERERQARRAIMAERAAYDGLNSGGAGSGAMDTEILSGIEDAGQRKSDVRSQLMGRAIEQQKQQLMQAMQLAVQSGDAESARALQLQIAQMDNQLRRFGMAQEQSRFDDQFGRQLGRDREDDRRWETEFGF